MTEDQYEERDDAETPKEFYTGVQSRGILGFPQEADPEIEKLLWEEEVIEYSESHGERIRDLFLFGATRAEIAETLNVPLNVVDEIVKRLNFTPYDDFTDEEHEEFSAFQRTVLWYENLRPIKKDLVMLAICVIVLTIWMLILTAVLP